MAIGEKQRGVINPLVDVFTNKAFMEQRSAISVIQRSSPSRAINVSYDMRAIGMFDNISESTYLEIGGWGCC